MARAGAPRRTVLKADLRYEGKDGFFSFPVFVYRKDNELATAGVKFHFYHEECGNRISYQKKCSHCDIVVDNFVKLAEVGGDSPLMVNQEEFRNTLYPNPSIEVKQSVAIKDVLGFVADNKFAFHEYYNLRAWKGDSKSKPVATVDKQLRALFDALERTKSYLVVSVPIGGLERLAFITPSGDLITLLYEEELRSDIDMETGPGETDKKTVDMFARFIRAHSGEMETISCSETLEKVEEFVSSQEPFIKARQNGVPVDMPSAKDVMMDLKDYVESRGK